MIKFIYIVLLISINYNVYGQFNQDAEEIKLHNIKSIKFSHDAQCTFDKEGRLTEYIDGDLDGFLSSSEMPPNKINKYTIDSLGNFTELTVFHYRNDGQGNLQRDTICYSKSLFNGHELDTSFSWEYTDYAYTKNEIYYSSYSRSIFGDTIVEKLYSFWKEVERVPELEIKFTVALTSQEVLFSFIKIPYNYYFSDSAISFMDSTNYGYRTIVKYNRKGNLKRSKVINGNTTTSCNHFRDNGEYFICDCKNIWGKKESSLSKKMLHPLSNQIRFEQFNQFCLRPYSLLINEDPKIQIEYYN